MNVIVLKENLELLLHFSMKYLKFLLDTEIFCSLLLVMIGNTDWNYHVKVFSVSLGWSSVSNNFPHYGLFIVRIH